MELFPWLSYKPVMFMIVYTVRLMNELTDHYNYGTKPEDLYDTYDFIIGEL